MLSCAMLTVLLGMGAVVLLATTSSGRTLWEYGKLRLRMRWLPADARAPAKPRRTMRAPQLVPPLVSSEKATRD